MNAQELTNKLNATASSGNLDKNNYADLVSQAEGVTSFNSEEIFFENGSVVAWERGRGWSVYS